MLSLQKWSSICISVIVVVVMMCTVSHHMLCARLLYLLCCCIPKNTLLQVRKLRQREAKEFVQGHRAPGQSQDLVLGFPKPMLSPSMRQLPVIPPRERGAEGNDSCHQVFVLQLRQSFLFKITWGVTSDLVLPERGLFLTGSSSLNISLLWHQGQSPGAHCDILVQ